MTNAYTQTPDFKFDINCSPSRTIIFDEISEVELTSDDDSIPNNEFIEDEDCEETEEQYIYYLFISLPFIYYVDPLPGTIGQEVMDIQ